MTRRRELVFGGAILALLLLGVGYGYTAHPAPAAQAASVVPLQGQGFASRAVYCPPSVAKMKDRTRIALAPQGAQAVPVSVQLAATPSTRVASSPSSTASAATTSAGAPAARPRTLRPGRVLLARSHRDRAVNVVGFGGRVLASAVTTGTSGAGAAPCAASAARHWYFAAGSSALGNNERLILYNPFPDEAVARVSFVTPNGRQTKANLADQAVPPGRTTILRLNDFILKQPLLSLQVDAIRGRLVAWRTLRVRARHQPRGEQLSMGASQPHDQWFLPDGEVGPGYADRIALLNPGAKAARVTISVLTATRTVQPDKLLNIVIPPATSKSVAPAAAIRGCNHRVCGIGAAITSTNHVGIVAERTMWYSTGHVAGVASEMGASRTAQDWYLGPASFAPTRDIVSVIDPTTATAKVSLTLVTADRKVAPHALQGLRIRAGTRLQVSINRWTRNRPFIAFLKSDQQVVAERFSYSRRAGDAAAIMGVALP